jgi:hypothetical protein
MLKQNKKPSTSSLREQPPQHHNHDSADPNDVKLACLHVLQGEMPPLPDVEEGHLLCRFCWQLKIEEEHIGILDDGRLIQLLRPLCPVCAQDLARRWGIEDLEHGLLIDMATWISQT